jgi:N-acetylglucosaminyl-diphospho-decaprenol L-rhamnosyltransferase
MESVTTTMQDLAAPHSCGSQVAVRPRVSVIIVTYCSGEELPACIGSLQEQSVPVEIFLVDNASPDDTGKIVSDYAAQYPNVRAILNQDNLGLAAGNNVPLGKCLGDYILILNPDTLLRKDALARMVEFLDQNSDVTVVGPKSVYPDGTPHSSFHRRWGIGHILLWRVLPFRLARSYYDKYSSYQFEDKLFVSGACLMIRRTTYELIGGYDPEYFLTVEDACDVCIRARKAAGRVVFLPEAEVMHIGGRSGEHAPYLVVWGCYHGSFYHFLKHKGKLQALIVFVLLLVSSSLRSLIASVMGIFNPKYREIAHTYGKVSWNLLVRNPFRAREWGRTVSAFNSASASARSAQGPSS